MTTMDASELEEHVREVLRKVEEGETIEVTRDGQVVARMIPVQSEMQKREVIMKALADLDKLAAEITAHWPPGVSAEDAVNDVRGDS